MTVNKLHQILKRLIDEGHGRKNVCIDKITFIHPLESDGCSVLPVRNCIIKRIPFIDDDGSGCINANGTERTELFAILLGNDKKKEEKP